MSYIQKIYYGVPGTGKSYQVEEFLKLNKIPEDQIFRVTFHPDYTYTDFTGQILPTSDNENKINYKFQMGVFTQALKMAFFDQSKRIYLIIEEMNRGNVSAIFGDIFQLLDRNNLGESRYRVRNTLIASQIKQLDNMVDAIYLPANLNIVGTVNTSDQNLFVMDNAFKRRFSWKYILNEPVKDSDGKVLNKFKYEFELYWKDNIQSFEWTEFYVKLNDFITDRNGGLGLREDKQIGQFYINYSDETPISEFRENINEKLMQYLWHDIHMVSYSDNSIFDSSLVNFSDLYRRLIENKRIFSDKFIEYYES